MIHIDRGRVPRPPSLDSTLAVREREDAERFYREGGPQQRRFDFRAYRQPDVVATLKDLFHGKCAYCEVKILASSVPDIEQFRPKGSVTERPDHPGYWWLVSDWDNLLLSCANCNRTHREAGEVVGKANRFPLADESARAFFPGEEEREQPLLLDPCRDSPEEHLVFDESGHVVSDTPQGQTSISVLGLNRADLLAARLLAARGVRRAIESLRSKLAMPRDLVGDELQREIRDLLVMTHEDEEFAGLKRQLVLPVLVGLDQETGVPLGPTSVVPTPTITKARQRSAKTAFHNFQVEQSSFSLADQKGRETYRSERRHIERVVIHNVKAIRNLELDLTDSDSGHTPWLMLLGENGTGKSTVLQSIALTLVGAAGVARLGESGAIHPGDYVRYRCRSGSVSVQMSGFVGPHRLTFRSDRIEFKSPTGEVTTVSFRSRGSPSVRGQGWEPQTVLLAYGATRLLPPRTSAATTAAGDSYSRVDNLFNPFVPLFDAERWLLRRGDAEFDIAALALKDLLDLAPEAKLHRERGRVMVFQHGDKVSLKALSDGYQSVVATAIDIFEVVTRLWPNLEAAEGIVLLDELGAHLHPTWKMRIVDAVRKTLPGVQFITSTHDPLCLRGLSAGEVVVMQRDERGRVEKLSGLPPPADFRIDQLLTSDFFGLSSTVDPETDRKFSEYHALLAVPKRSQEQERRLAELESWLKDAQYLGTTLRESLMYAAVDRIVAQHKLEPVRTLPQLKQEAIDEIARIWAEDEPAPASP